MRKYIKILLLLLVCAGVGFGVQYLVLQMSGLQSLWKQTDYSLVGMYTFSGVGSLVVAVFLSLTNYAMPKYTSFVFLGCVLIKMFAGYLFIQEGLNVFENNFLELNFLVSFFLFLAYDAYVAYLFVNQDIKAVGK